MLKRTHIKIADSILLSIQNTVQWKINRQAYLFGSIAPDLNVAFPAHTLTKTFNRFKRRLVRVEKSDSSIIKSFTLGVITHYICDYFCYAHNIKNNPKHAIYERVMKNHLDMHNREIREHFDELQSSWDEVKGQILLKISDGRDVGIPSLEEVKNNFDKEENSEIKWASCLGDMLKDMHDLYMAETSDLDEPIWSRSHNKIQLDLEYATFMCEKMTLTLLGSADELREN